MRSCGTTAQVTNDERYLVSGPAASRLCPTRVVYATRTEHGRSTVGAAGADASRQCSMRVVLGHWRDAPKTKISRASELARRNGMPAVRRCPSPCATLGRWAAKTVKARNDLAHEGGTPNHIIEGLVAVVEPTRTVSLGRLKLLDLPERVSDCDYVHSQTEVALAYAEQSDSRLCGRDMNRPDAPETEV